MKQEIKSQISKEKIQSVAIEQFGKRGYAGASFNTLLSDNGLSKGLVYHYFQSKDELYLTCVTACFDMLMTSLSQIRRDDSAIQVLHTYFETRSRFFQDHPMLERVFFDAILQPPAHLDTELAKIRTVFDTFNQSLFQDVVNGVTLREGVSEADALFYFNLMQRALHLQYRFEEGDYEEKANKTMEFLLFGLVGGNQS